MQTLYLLSKVYLYADADLLSSSAIQGVARGQLVHMNQSPL